MLKRILFLSLFMIITFACKTSACSIFMAAKKGEVLAAGNEDWSDPFSKMWVTPRSKDRYGSINFGHSDFQCQTAINEFGLFYDYAAMDKAAGKLMDQKQTFDGDLFFEIIGKCKNVEEALIYLERYQFGSAYCQVLLADATGRSVIVSQDIILENQSDYQVTTNFNACEISSKNYDCRRFQIIEESLSSQSEISVSLFRNLLSRVHQEGKYPSQYSYVFDLKKGIMHLYSFHNYENTLQLNIKEEIEKGFQLYELKELFPLAYEEEYFRLQHPDSLKKAILEKLKTEDAENGLVLIQNYLNQNPSADINQDNLLWEIGIGALQETWVKDSQGMPFTYWWYPKKYANWKSKNSIFDRLLDLFNTLEKSPKDDPKKYIGIYEMKGLILFIQNQNDQAKTYFEKTIAIAPEESGNFKRAKIFLNRLK